MTQPRVPAGSKEGGQFAEGNAGSAGVDPAKRKPVTQDGSWGHSHTHSQAITGEAADIMALPGYRKNPQNAVHHRQIAEKMLAEIHGDEVGSPEALTHGFAKSMSAKVGDTFKIPTTASATDRGLDNAEGWAIGDDPHSTKGHTIIVFPKGTPMAGYAKNNKEFREEAGIWSEAIVAGHFRVTKVEKHQASPRWMRAKGVNVPSEFKPMIDVVHVENIGVFNPVTRKWRRRG